MERDVTGWLHKGETVPNLVAGLAYSIALNYLNRVVRGRKIGNVIYFQGGTAYNDAVTAAFASLLGKKITVPPYNGVMGAIGMALIARQWHQATGAQTRFRGYDLHKLQLSTRDFVCKACSNLCDMKEFVIEGQKSYWGDKCSDKFRKPSPTGRKPVIEDLFAYREQLLEALPNAAGGPVPRGPAARHGDARPAALLAPLLRRAGHPHRAFAGDRPAHLRRRNRDGRGAALLPGAGGARPRAGAGRSRAWTTSWFPTSRMPKPAPIPAPSHYCPWNQTLPWVLRVGARARAAPAQVPDSDAAFPARPRAGEEGAGRNHAPPRRDAPRQRPRRGRRLRGRSASSRTSCWKPAGARWRCWTRPASPAWCWPAAATTSTTAA